MDGTFLWIFGASSVSPARCEMQGSDDQVKRDSIDIRLVKTARNEVFITASYIYTQLTAAPHKCALHLLEAPSWHYAEVYGPVDASLQRQTRLTNGNWQISLTQEGTTLGSIRTGW